MKKALSKLILLNILGWRIEGDVPKEKKYLIVVAPHTSNFDFIIGILARNVMGFNPKYLAKDSLFKFPFGYFFKALGGYPVDRSRRSNMVEQVIDIYNAEEEFIITVAPEGTRGLSEKWKTGFYHIALGANIPVVLVYFDYGKKVVHFANAHYVDPDKEKEMQKIYNFYRGVEAAKPENFKIPQA
ncbi:MAG: acyltransferase [Chitinophagales bacterium]|nr:acyltransferase [Chitinophagales bacterium]